MAQRFTYDEFQRELTNSGLGSEFSSADLKLAQQNPDAGMSILKYKRDYHNATTPEQRALRLLESFAAKENEVKEQCLLIP